MDGRTDIRILKTGTHDLKKNVWGSSLKNGFSATKLLKINQTRRKTPHPTVNNSRAVIAIGIQQKSSTNVIK